MKKVYLLLLIVLSLLSMTGCEETDETSVKREISDTLTGILKRTKLKYDESTGNNLQIMYSDLYTKDSFIYYDEEQDTYNSPFLNLNFYSAFAHLEKVIRECDDFKEDEYCINYDEQAKAMYSIDDDVINMSIFWLMFDDSDRGGSNRYNYVDVAVKYIDDDLHIEYDLTQYDSSDHITFRNRSFYYENHYFESYFNNQFSNPNITYEYYSYQTTERFFYSNFYDENQFGYSMKDNDLDYSYSKNSLFHSLSFYKDSHLFLYMEDDLNPEVNEDSHRPFTMWNLLEIDGWETVSKRNNTLFLDGSQFNLLNEKGRLSLNHSGFGRIAITFEYIPIDEQFSMLLDSGLSLPITQSEYSTIINNLETRSNEVISSYGFGLDDEDEIALINSHLNTDITTSDFTEFISLISTNVTE